jgi:uncharacterized repeat protein (TIGR01451 family)
MSSRRLTQRAGFTLASRPGRNRAARRLRLESFEERTVPTVSVLNNSGNGYSALSFNQSGGGYVPPDTDGAAGPSAYVETVNQEIALYPNKATGAGAVTDSLSHFLFTTGGLPHADSGSGLSDPVIAYDEKIGRFVVGDQDVNFNTHVSNFDVAVSKSSNPASLSAADWSFFKITTTQAGEDADYPGNFGYNADAVVFTLNMFAVAGTSGTNHVQVISVNAADLAAGVAPHVFANNLADFSVRPTAMHDAAPGDPMWLVTEHGDGLSIDVYKMTSVLSTSANFAPTNLAVTAYSGTVAPRNPSGSTITTNIDSRIQKASEANNTIVAVHSVAVSSTQDVAQWYAIDVSSGTPALAQQGRVSAGSNTYVTYPAIDINPAGAIGMTFMRSGTDTSTDYMSMWVTGRIPTDAAGTMEPAVKVPAGTGQTNYTDFANPHRAGDLSGINVDPVDGSFWAANEFANTQAFANWGTAVANFQMSAPANSADVAVTVTGPSSVTAGTNATYTVTVTNSGPNAASGVVLTDTLPAGSTFVSMDQTAGADSFTLSQSGGTATETAGAAIASGSSDTFTLIVTAAADATPGSTFNDTASVTATTADPNTSNNSATQSGTIVGAPADLAVATSGTTTANEGDQVTYTVTVTNTDSANSGTGVVLTDTLGANLTYVSATTSQGTFSQSGGVVTFNVATLAPGASATLTVTAQATEDGTVTDSASVTSTSADPNTTNNSSSASTSVAEPAIVVSGPITVSGRSQSNIVVATFTHAGGVESTGAFNAIINWGDGKTSTGTITLSGTTYTVRGSHRYNQGGTHTVTTTVTEVGQAAQLLQAKAGVEVPDLPARPGDHGQPTLGDLVGQLTDLVESYIGGSSDGGGSDQAALNRIRSTLTVLLNRAAQEHVAPPIVALEADLHAQDTSDSRVLDVLLLMNDVLADHGM